MSIEKIRISESHLLPLAEPRFIKYNGKIKILEYDNGNIFRKMEPNASIKIKLFEGTHIEKLEDNWIAIIYDNKDFTIKNKRKCCNCNNELTLIEFEKSVKTLGNNHSNYNLDKIKEIWINPNEDIYCLNCISEYQKQYDSKKKEILTSINQIIAIIKQNSSKKDINSL